MRHRPLTVAGVRRAEVHVQSLERRIADKSEGIFLTHGRAQCLHESVIGLHPCQQSVTT